MNVTVMLACNDEQGIFQHDCDMLRIDTPSGHVLAMEGRRTTLREYTDPKRVLRFGRIALAFKASQQWAGNVLWNSYTMSLMQARKLVRHALDRREWMVTEVTDKSPFAADLARPS